MSRFKMHGLLITLLFLPLCSLAAETKAQVVPGPTVPAPVIAAPATETNWISHGSSEPVTINNGNGNNLTITITVDGSATASPNASVPGVTVKNCGKTQRIDPGSSAICTTNDAVNPVSFASDSQDTATGTYKIEQK